MPLFQNATYAASVAEPSGAWPESVAEIAFAGRSNAGKSSAINTLAGQRRLAFVSKTPGRTQLINFFSLGEARFLVDLPGYGFASAPHEVRARWGELIGAYVTAREPLKGLALVMDIRHPLTDLDQQLLEFFRPTGKPVHVLLAKADKLSGSAARSEFRSVSAALAQLSPRYSAQLFSSLKRDGIEAAESVFSGWLGIALPQAKPRAEMKRPREASRGLK
jgi:GTP-binding protein